MSNVRFVDSLKIPSPVSETATSASYASFATSASYALNTDGGAFTAVGISGSWQGATSSMSVLSASYATTASYAISASHEIITELSSSHADTADTAAGLTGQPSIYVTNITASGDISSSGDITGTDLYMGQYLYHIGDEDTYLRFGVNLVNLVAGGKSAIIFDKSTGKIQINNTNGDYDLNVMGDDGSVILATDAVNNRVGINTTTPSEALDVSGSLNVFGELGHITASGNISASGTASAAYLYSSDNAQIDTNLKVGNRVTSNYGTVNYSLTVNELNNGGGDFRVEGATDPYLIFSDASADKVSIGKNVVSQGVAVSLLEVDGDITATHITASGNISASGTGSFGSIEGPVDGDFAIRSDKSINLYLDKDNDSPFTKLQVYDGSGAIKFAVAEDGKAAIGEAVDSDSLDGLTVVGGITATGNITGSNISASGLLYVSASQGVNGTDNWTLLYNTGSGQVFYTASSAVGGGGGTSGPFTQVGSSTTWNTIDDTNLKLTGSLTISGSFHSFTLDSDNIVLGSGAGPVMVAGADYNTIIGTDAGQILTSGDSNVMIGKEAGADTISTSHNVMIGDQAGAIGRPSGVVHIGSSAGRGSGPTDSTSYNIFVGYFAGYKVGIADWNIGIGESALYNINDGDKNLAIGRDAGYNITDGSSNIIIGSGSLGEAALEQQLRIGNGNSLVTISASLVTGDIIFPSTASAAYFSGDGSNLTNVSAFPFTGDAQITGSLTVSGSFIPHGIATDVTNVIIGKDAATNITSTSGYNIVIGNEAGGGVGPFADADGNVCIGYQAGNGIDGGDYNICIGHQAGYIFDDNIGMVAIGWQALRNAGNSYSVGIGDNTGRFQQSGPNTLLGGFSGYGVNGQSDATYNAFIGYKAGYLLRDGNYNVIIGGSDTGYSINNGDGNIILGTYAGKNIIDGDYNIIIGHSASFAADVSNQLFIGSASFATISASLTTGDIIFPSTASAAYFSGDGSKLTNLPSTAAGLWSGSAAIPTATGDVQISGSLVISGSSLPLRAIGSGSTVFDVIGSEGTLFSVDDDLDGILFTTNDRTGLPILQASASGELYLGKSPQSLYTTAVISATSASATASVYALSTSSYDGVFFDYTITSASNSTVGSIMSVWNGGTVSYNEYATSSIGTIKEIAGLELKVIISASQAQFIAITDNTDPNIWKVKTIIRSI